MHGATAAAHAMRDADGALVYLLHANADPDCVGAAYALATTFGGTAWAVSGVSAAGRRLARALAFAIMDDVPDAAAYPWRVVVDTGSRVQLRDAGATVSAESGGRFILVDHHEPGDLAEAAAIRAVDPTRASACEVALAILDAASTPLGADVARALLAGIVSDTARFTYADARTLGDASRLLAASGLATIEDALPLVHDEEAEEAATPLQDYSRRMAQLKAASRAEIHPVGTRIVVTSEIASHEAGAALALTRAGADVAFVAAAREEGTRVSARARREVADAVHLGRIMRATAEDLGCGGGGHAASAGMSGAPEASVVFPRLLKAVERAFREADAVQKEAA